MNNTDKEFIGWLEGEIKKHSDIFTECIEQEETDAAISVGERKASLLNVRDKFKQLKDNDND